MPFQIFFELVVSNFFHIIPLKPESLKYINAVVFKLGVAALSRIAKFQKKGHQTVHIAAKWFFYDVSSLFRTNFLY